MCICILMCMWAFLHYLIILWMYNCYILMNVSMYGIFKGSLIVWCFRLRFVDFFFFRSCVSHNGA